MFKNGLGLFLPHLRERNLYPPYNLELDKALSGKQLVIFKRNVCPLLTRK